MADDPVTAVYTGGDALLDAATGELILPGDRRDVAAELVDVEGSPWASRMPRGQADRLALLAANYTNAAAGEDVTPDPLDQVAPEAPDEG